MISETEFPDDVIEKIVAYIDRQDGKDSPLTADDEAMVAKLLEDDPDAQRFADSIRDVNTKLDTMFDDLGPVTVSPSLINMIDGLAADDILAFDQPSASNPAHAVDEVRQDNVLGLRQTKARRFSYAAPLAAAASIVAVVSLGALLHFYTDFEIERIQMTAQLDASSIRLEAGESALEEAKTRLAGLSGDLENRTASLDQTATDLQEAESRILSLEIDRDSPQLTAALGEAEQALAQQSLKADLLRDQVATLTADISELDAERFKATLDIAGLEIQLESSKSWIGQVAQYHRVYASAPRGRLVEAKADEKADIEDWLGGMIGRELVVPDLSEMGVTFAGARLLGVNEKPVAQLVYLDKDNQPLALCIIANTAGKEARAPSTNGDLNIVHWRDDSHAFLVVGWTEPDLLSTLADAIQPIYDL